MTDTKTLSGLHITDRYCLFDEIRKIKGDPYRKSPYNILMSPWYMAALSSLEHEGSENKHKKKVSLQRIKIAYEDRIQSRFNVLRAKFLSSPLRKCDLVFWPVEPTHTNQQIPVYDELIKKGIPFQIVTNRPPLAQSLKAKGYDVHFIESRFYPSQKYPSLDLLEKYFNTTSGKDQADSAEAKFLLNTFSSLYTSGYKETIMQLLSFLSYLAEQFHCKKLVVGYDVTPEGRLAALYGKELSIETYCLMHGSIAGEPMDAEHIVDHFLVYGEAARKHLLNIGNKPGSVVITGAAYLDRIPLGDKTIHPALQSLLKVDPSKPYFLVALSGPGHCTSFHHFNRIIRKIMQLSRNDRYQFVSKLHRKDTIQNYQPLAEESDGQKLQVVPNGTDGYPKNIFDWLRGCTAILTGSSTVALEAMLMNVPVITMDFMNEHQGVDFIELGATIHVTDENGLEQAMENLLHRPEMYHDVRVRASQYANEFFFKPDGKASERIVEAIIQ